MPFNPVNFTRNAVLIAGVVGLGSWWAVAGVIPNLAPKRFGTVEAGRLYRSGALTSAALENVVEAEHIETIVDLGGFHTDSPDDRREQRAAEVLGVERYRFPLIGDGTGDPNRYVAALRVMLDPQAEPVLVHCSAGSQRTGVAVVLYRMQVDGWTLDQAIEEARTYDHDPTSNPRFRPYLEQWAGPIFESLRTGEPIPYDGPTFESTSGAP